MEKPKTLRIVRNVVGTETCSHEREVSFVGFLSSDGIGKSIVTLDLGNLNGTAEFSISHGRGMKGLVDWKLIPEDQDMLLDYRRSMGVKVAKTPRSSVRKRRPRVPRNRCKKTREMW